MAVELNVQSPAVNATAVATHPILGATPVPAANGYFSFNETYESAEVADELVIEFFEDASVVASLRFASSICDNVGPGGSALGRLSYARITYCSQPPEFWPNSVTCVGDDGSGGFTTFSCPTR